MFRRSPVFIWVSSIMSALPDFMIAWVCLVTWFQPYAYRQFGVKWAVLLLLQEFLVIHSAGFFAAIKASDMPLPKKAFSLFGLSVFYSLFAAGMSLAIGSWTILCTLWALCLNRMTGTLFGQAPAERAKTLAMANWAVSVVFYLFAVFLTVMLPVPSFGITPDVIHSQGFTIGGLWPEEPYRAIAACVIYYFCVGVWELISGIWINRKDQQKSAEDKYARQNV